MDAKTGVKQEKAASQPHTDVASRASPPTADLSSNGALAERNDILGFAEDLRSSDSSKACSGPDGNDDEGEYPEGGTRAWLVVLGCWLALFSSLGIMNILATFQTYVSTHQLEAYDDGTIGWIFSVYTFLSFFMGLYIGPLFDKHGPRWLIAAGTACLAASLMLMSVAYQYWHFMLAFGVFSGLGSSLLLTPSIAAVGHWFRARRGLATGIASTAGSLGGVIYPLMLQRLFSRLGWGWAVRTLSFITLALCIAANFLIRSRLPPNPKASAHPDPRIFRSRPFALTVAAVFMLELALFIPLTYISSYALSQGFSQAFSFDILTILNTGSVFGRILPGYAADRIGPFNANIMSVALTIVATFCIWLPAGGTTAGLVIYALVFGFTSGANISLVPVAIGRLCMTREYGRYYATCYTVVSIACLVGIPTAGRVVAANGDEYWGLIVMTGVVYCGSLMAFTAARVSVVGWSLRAIM